MKATIKKAAAVLLLVSMLVFSLTGCDVLDYRNGINLYNEGRFDDAAEIFANLGTYEDSADLLQRSRYWAAVTLAEQGNYKDALNRFEELGSYAEASLWVTECKYQIAVASFDADMLTGAETLFQEISGYKQTDEYLRRLAWIHLFDALAQSGAESGGSFTLSQTQDGYTVSITAQHGDPASILFFISSDREEGYWFHDDLTLTLTRDTPDAAFVGTSIFEMDFDGIQIGTSQTSSGTLNIQTWTPQSPLTVTAFEKTVTDNQGKTSHSQDPADSLMQEQMQTLCDTLLAQIPQLLTDAGIEITLADIGFTAIP